MKLLVDWGNSALKWAQTEGDRLGEPGRCEWRPATDLDALLDHHWRSLPQPSAVVASLVGPPETAEALGRWTGRRWGLTPRLIGAQRKSLGVTCGYHQPERLGADRWAALVAAHQLAPAGALVVDLGTATTLDALSGGRHLGGYILPGPEALQGALLDTTAIELDQAADDPGPWGRSTAGCIRQGAVQALVALVESSLERLQAAGVCDPTLIVTGGQAGFLMPHIQVDYLHRPHLVLEGVMLLAREATS